jgi:hypothetical protein
MLNRKATKRNDAVSYYYSVLEEKGSKDKSHSNSIGYLKFTSTYQKVLRKLNGPNKFERGAEK